MSILALWESPRAEGLRVPVPLQQALRSEQMALYSPVGGGSPQPAREPGYADHQDDDGPVVRLHAVQNPANVLQAQLIGRKGRPLQEGPLPIPLNLVQAEQRTQGAGGPSSISIGGR